MKTILTMGAIALCISVISPFASAQSQMEMNERAAKELAVQDKALNKYYQILMKGEVLSPQTKQDLRESQRAWNKYVEFHMKTLFPLDKGENPRVVYGSIYPMEFAMEKTTLVVQRVKQLKVLVGGDAGIDQPTAPAKGAKPTQITIAHADSQNPDVVLKWMGEVPSMLYDDGVDKKWFKGQKESQGVYSFWEDKFYRLTIDFNKGTYLESGFDGDWLPDLKGKWKLVK